MVVSSLDRSSSGIRQPPKCPSSREDLKPQLDCKLAKLRLGQATIEEDWGSTQKQDPWHSFSVARAYHAKKTRTGLMKMMKKSRK